MSKQLFPRTNDLISFLDKLSPDYEVYVPVKKGEHRFYRKYPVPQEDVLIGEVRAFERGERIFSPGPQRDTVLDEQGNVWQVTEDALLGPGGEVAPRLPGHLAYWFGWYAFFPNTQIYK